MVSARDQMKMLNDELEKVREEIARLRIEEGVLEKMLARMSGQPEQKKSRSRSSNVKPIVLDIMRDAGASGATSAEVDQLVRQQVPTVAKDTVSSVLSRLKADGALTYYSERYYEKRHAPEPSKPADIGLRAVG